MHFWEEKAGCEPQVGEIEMGFSNFLCIQPLRESLTIRAWRTPSPPPLCGGRFAHYLPRALLIKRSCNCGSSSPEKHKDVFREGKSPRSFYDPAWYSACFSHLLPFIQHQLLLVLSVTTSGWSLPLAIEIPLSEGPNLASSSPRVKRQGTQNRPTWP